MKKGQIQLAFNWVYILIAGAVILLFFVGIVAKQKVAADEKLSNDVVVLLDSIFTGAGVSEQTKNFIDTSGLVEVPFYFTCYDGVGEFGVAGQGAAAQDEIVPLFSPSEIQTAELITWSIPYKLPFKVSDFLIVSSRNTKYYFAGFDVTIANATEGFNTEWVGFGGLATADPGNNRQVRIVDLQGNLLSQPLSPELQEYGSDLTGVNYLAPERRVVYYSYSETGWQPLGDVPLLSLPGERDAPLYASFFAADDDQYLCNMQKALTRATLVHEIYQEKGKDLSSYYRMKASQSSPQQTLYRRCADVANREAPIKSIDTVLEDYRLALLQCQRSLFLPSDLRDNNCQELLDTAQELQETNKLLVSCPAAIY